MAAMKKPRMSPALLTQFVDTISSTVVLSHYPEDRTPSVTIGTHDGSFHCDEALAIAMLKCLPEYKAASVVRTRKPDALAACSIVVDVGATYDSETLRFDHHQREFTGTLDGYETKLSSAGLVYKHFGRDVIRRILCEHEGKESFDNELIEIYYNKVYKNFVEHVDAIDNGIAVADAPLKYNISTTLSSRVGSLNPSWNEPNTPEVCNDRFLEAMHLTGSEFLSTIIGLSDSWWPARSIVASALESEKRLALHPSGQIALLEQFCPWKDHLFVLEEEKDITGQILYILFQDSGGSWRVQAVPVEPNSFDSRKKLPEAWRGVRDETLSELVGVPGAVFVHAGGFIGGHSTKEGALAMATQALDM